jgi:hypothetical protein
MTEVSTLSEVIEVATNIVRDSECLDTTKGCRPVALSASFGTWFRGQANASWPLEPGLFRQEQVNLRYVENGLFHHFQLVAPEYHQNHRNAFDWLCLMQHYGLPTRLIDWTENLLTAVYFAVHSEQPYSLPSATRDKEPPFAVPGANGRVFVLAPRALNRLEKTGPRYPGRGIIVPESFHTLARALLARSSTHDQWAEEIARTTCNGSSWDADEQSSFADKSRKQLRNEKLTLPIAVFPNRANRRLIAQSGTFTIHGGKYSHADPDFAPPRSLEDLNKAAPTPFLWSFDILASTKPEIERALWQLGIHKGTLFPDLEQQASHLKDIWSRIQRQEG